MDLDESLKITSVPCFSCGKINTLIVLRSDAISPKKKKIIIKCLSCKTKFGKVLKK